FIRADLNVPVKDGKVTSDARIRASLPTIELALKQGAKVMVTSTWVVLPKASTTKNSLCCRLLTTWQDKLFNPVRLVKDYLDGVDVAEGEPVVFGKRSLQQRREERRRNPVQKIRCTV
ncbi:phosphoglycerate kinase, partial [Escherichia coli]|nr:phosphoglycerate kinase [Escherichia coli]